MIAWLVVVPWAAWAAVRVLGIERGYPFVQLMAYTPYVAPLALAGGAVAALLRRWAPAARAGLGDLLPHDVLGPGRRGGSGLYSRVPLRPLAPFQGAKSEMAAAALDVPGAAPLRVISVHVAVPLDGGDLARWRADLRALPPAPPRGPVQLLAGDFNATLDHAQLRGLVERGYRDAAEAVGAGLKPTWQGHVAPPVTIDHVLVPERCGVLGVSVHELPRSDHRAVLAVLALP